MKSVDLVSKSQFGKVVNILLHAKVALIFRQIYKFYRYILIILWNRFLIPQTLYSCVLRLENVNVCLS